MDISLSRYQNSSVFESSSKPLTDVNLFQERHLLSASYLLNRRKRRAQVSGISCSFVEQGLHPKPKPKPLGSGHDVVKKETHVQKSQQMKGSSSGLCSQIEKLVLCKRYRDALETFEILEIGCEYDVHVGKSTYDALVDACISLKSIRGVKRVFNYMINSGFEPDLYLRNRMLLMHVKCGMMIDARMLFDEMPEKNLVSWNTIIAGLLDSGDYLEAFRLFLIMWEDQSEASSRTFATMMRASAGLGMISPGQQLHACAIKMDVSQDIFVSCALIDMYSKCGSIEDAQCVFDEMPEKTTVGWNTIIAGYALHGYSEEALDLYYEMQDSGVKMDHFTFSMIVRVCTRLASLEHAKQAHAGLIRHGFGLDIVANTALVDFYSKWGRIDDARNVFDKMPQKNVISWNALIAGYGDKSKSDVKFCHASSSNHFTGSYPDHHHHHHHAPASEQPLAKIAIQKALIAVQESACITANPLLLGCEGEDTEWVKVDVKSDEPSAGDWVGVFSPANFNSSKCYSESDDLQDGPSICTAPIKYMFANHSNSDYATTGRASLTFQIINQRSDFSFALFSGGLENPKLITASSPISFANPKAPLYPRLAHGKVWDEMAVTWTSGYNVDEATPFVEWGWEFQTKKLSPAGTLTFTRSSMCGAPARTVGWRDPGFIHTSFLKDLWPNTMYTYRMGHKLTNGSFVWSKLYSFNSSPYPGQDSLQRVVIFGDMGKAERDGSNEYDNYQPGSLTTTNQLTSEIDDYDIVFHIGNLAYAKGYISQWDQFTAQIEPIASRKPYMVASGNNERDFPNSGSFYLSSDSGGECGVPAETIFYVPADNRAKFWYSTDYGMFHFCIADSEHDWREGSEQYAWIEKCLASVDRQKQPWLIFAANRVLGYSSSSQYTIEGTLGEPMGREHLQKLWQKYKVDMAFYGHVHSYERTCPVYQDQCVSLEKYNYSGTVLGTIHVVVGGGGSELSTFAYVDTEWSLYKDHDWGFVKLTAFNHSSLLFEYKKSKDGEVFDSFTISRDYKDVLACVHDGCGTSTLAP
ncbi:hypothetical protein L2E82_16024 [Cichorium intybus]|uniref:Uncharacterized protein n=1 Tax=Cichorium intybus TaxID=13427 RepID=A0ACB9F4D7_CICIN|nr:hypothetical protein L2E82_16024 [Cichorium intybus]